MTSPQLTFHPIELPRDAETCLAIRRDSFVISFGNDAQFDQWAGPEGARYLEDLAGRTERWPGSVVHVYAGDELAGQVELRVVAEDVSECGSGALPGGRATDCVVPQYGYVNLFYLMPEFRGCGLGAELEKYTLDFFRRHGCAWVRLTVSPKNTNAVDFYERHGWRCLGRAPGDLHVLLYEKAVKGE